MTNNELKSKVMKIANRTARELGRSNAMRQAWWFVERGSLEVPVRGVSFGNRPEALRRLESYRPHDVRAVVVPEPENPVDKDALAVKVGVQGGRGFFTLGYIPAGMVAVVKAFIGQIPRIRIISGENGRGARLYFAMA